LHSTGTCKVHGQFSNDIVGTVVRDYAFLASKLSDERWDLIMELCGDIREQPALVAHSMKVNRRELYEASSPPREDDE
jgi:hypothetical protein